MLITEDYIRRSRPYLASAAWTLGILILLGTVFWAIDSSKGFRNCAQNQGEYSTKENNYNEPPPVLVSNPSAVGVWFACAGGFSNENGGAITAIATVILTLSTIALWFTTSATAKIAERTLTDLERPWLHIKAASVDGILVDPPFIEIEKVNYGRIVGTVEKIRAAFIVSSFEITPEKIAAMKLNEMPLEEVGNSIPPDKPYTSKISFKKYLKPQIPAGIGAGSYNIVVRAVLHYSGLNEADYETGFCFRYQADRHRFVQCGGKKYNYTK